MGDKVNGGPEFAMRGGLRAARGLQAGVGGLDDDADGFLVESFETAPALQILQMAAEGSVLHELQELGFVNQARAP